MQGPFRSVFEETLDTLAKGRDAVRRAGVATVSSAGREAPGSGVWGSQPPPPTLGQSACPGVPGAPPLRAEEGPGRGEPSREVGILGAELISSSRPPLARTPSPRAAPGARGRAAEDAGHVRTRQVRPEVVPGPGRDGALHGPPRAQGG